MFWLKSNGEITEVNEFYAVVSGPNEPYVEVPVASPDEASFFRDKIGRKFLRRAGGYHHYYFYDSYAEAVEVKMRPLRERVDYYRAQLSHAEECLAEAEKLHPRV
jgi:hypothetical protein